MADLRHDRPCRGAGDVAPGFAPQPQVAPQMSDLHQIRRRLLAYIDIAEGELCAEHHLGSWPDCQAPTHSEGRALMTVLTESDPGAVRRVPDRREPRPPSWPGRAPTDEEFFRSLWNDDDDSPFPTMRWYGDRKACRDCRHSINAHGPDGCVAVVNVHRGGSSWSFSGDRKNPPSSGSSPGVLAYSYPCPCRRVNASGG